jgi:hypothetical protein
MSPGNGAHCVERAALEKGEQRASKGMPTNLLRKKATPVRPLGQQPRKGAPRRIVIRAGRVAIRADLLATPTADRIWAALPLHSTAETWGQAVHFETPIETGRERGARMLAKAGEICFWVEEDRVLIVFGPTPISRPGERRLPSPCNVWANAIDDVTLLNVVAAGEKVSVTAA